MEYFAGGLTVCARVFSALGRRLGGGVDPGNEVAGIVQGCLLNKLLTRIAVTRACENKMAQNIDGKPLHKTTVSWFDFLFDKTGDLLKKHLDNASAG